MRFVKLKDKNGMKVVLFNNQCLALRERKKMTRNVKMPAKDSNEVC